MIKSNNFVSLLFGLGKGNEVGKKIADKISGVLDAISDGLTEEERVAFYRSLSIISESLEAVCKK